MNRTTAVGPGSAPLVVAVACMLCIVAGCGTHKPFELMEDTIQIRPSGTVAVISTDASEATVRLAEYLTRALRERSTFKVLSQEEIGRRVGKYPVAIKEAKPENIDKPVWFAKGEKGKIDAIQAQVKADYLFLVWTGNLSRITTTSSRGGGSVTYTVNVDANVLEYPKGRPVGYSIFAGSKGQTCCLFGKSEGEDINDMLKESAGLMADKFISAAKAEKTGK